MYSQPMSICHQNMRQQRHYLRRNEEMKNEEYAFLNSDTFL